ncbi:MAG: YbeD family protein [Gammaproteobacteria bacterium]
MNETESAMQFPCRFPIKAVGKADAELDIVVVEIVRRHVGDIREGAVTSRASKGGKYSAVTITIEATSKEQLDNIYNDLSACADVIMAL